MRKGDADGPVHGRIACQLGDGVEPAFGFDLLDRFHAQAPKFAFKAFAVIQSSSADVRCV